MTKKLDRAAAGTVVPLDPPFDGEPAGWLAAIFAASFDAIIGWRLDGTIVSWNPAAEELYGYAQAEVVGRNILLIVPPERIGERERLAAAVARGERIPPFQTERLRKGSERIAVSLTLSPVRDPAGTIVGAATTTRSMEAQQTSERLLRDSQERLLAALAASETGTFRWDIRRDVLHWDDNLRAMFGLARERTVSTIADFLEIVHPEDREALLAQLRRCIAGEESLAYEFRIVRPDGVTRWIADSARILRDETGEAAWLTGACRDVTGRREREARLERALAENKQLLRQKDMLLQEVNHRVKNNLQLISSLLSMQQREVQDATARSHIGEAMSRVAAMALIHDRLYRAADLRTIELGDYIGSLCADLAGSLGSLHRPRDLTVLAGQPMHLPSEQVVPLALIVSELVTNAFKYAYPHDRSGGRIEVALDGDGDGRLAITVRDDGAGLPDGFDPVAAGGLGMKLVVGLARQLGGALECGPPGGGARFTIRIDTGRASG